MSKSRHSWELNRRDFLALSASTLASYSVLANSETPSQKKLPFQSLSNSYDDLNPDTEYDAIIIGSGYGGSILAARLAEAGQKVCLLERGKEWMPGEFPRSLAGFTANLYGPLNKDGLFDMNVQPSGDMDVVCASGLGGTSLINAAIATTPEPLVFEQTEWPEEIRQAHKSGELKTYYDKASQVLHPTFDLRTAYTRKVQIHKQTLNDEGTLFRELPLCIHHQDDLDANSKNSYGAVQKSCTACGECCAGCNIGAKNTLQMNYLTLAKAHGAEIYVSMEVDSIEKTNRGFNVYYKRHGSIQAELQNVKDKIWSMFDEKTTLPLKAKQVIVSAGSLGTTEILMRSQDKRGLTLSKALGSRVSANGDVLGFSYNGSQRTNIINGTGFLPGQALMSYGDYREKNKQKSIMEHFLLIEGTVPSALAPTLAKSLALYAMANYKKFTSIQKERSQLDLKNPMRLPNEGALNHSMVYLACGHDSSGGRYVRGTGGRAKVIWPNVQDELSFRTINEEMQFHAKRQGGYFITNPMTNLFGRKSMVATHPLGGCPMADNISSGVVNHRGQVFASENNDVHQGLYVVDGSIIPRSLGATPLLTISALAERTADLIIHS